MSEQQLPPPTGEMSGEMSSPLENLSAAESLGLKDGNFNVIRNSGAVERGWSVDSISTRVIDGEERKIVDISIPNFDAQGNRLYLEDGTPEDSVKSMPVEMLMAMQEIETAEIPEVSETEYALAEVGAVAVEPEIEVAHIDEDTDITIPNGKLKQIREAAEVAPKSATESIPSQIKDKGNWAKNVVAVGTEANTPIFEDKVTTSQEQPTKTPGNKETDDSTIEKTKAVQETSEAMSESFDRVTEQLTRLSQDALPLSEKISRTPGEIATEIKSFMQTIEGASYSLNQSVRSIKNLLNAAETGFLTQLEWNANQPIEDSDIIHVQNLREVVSRIANQLGILQSDVEHTQQQGTHAQANMSESILNLMGNTAKSINEFVSNDVGVVYSEIDEAGIELTRLALEQGSDQEDAAEPDDNEGLVNDADAQHMDNLSHVKNRLHSESGYLQDDVENAVNVVTRKLGLDSQDFTRTILDSARLQPRNITEITSELNSAAMKLEMAARMNGSKGSLYAEIGYGVKQVIDRAFEAISMFRNVDTENPDVQTDIIGAQSRAKEAAKNAESFIEQLALFARESQR